MLIPSITAAARLSASKLALSNIRGDNEPCWGASVYLRELRCISRDFISLLCIVLLRNPLLARFHFRNQHLPVNSLVGQSARALESIAPGQVGKVELHGTSWSARNTGVHGILPDTVCRVHHIEGLTLHVRLQET